MLLRSNVREVLGVRQRSHLPHGLVPLLSTREGAADKKKVSFTEIDVDNRPDLRSFLVSASGQRTVPQIFINGRSIGGSSELDALDRRGELDRLLATPPPHDAPVLPV